MGNKMKCNEVVKKETIKLKNRSIKVECKNLHGNCQYLGLWEPSRNTITLDAKRSPKDRKGDRGHELFHAAVCIVRQALGDDESDMEIVSGLCAVCEAQDTDALFASMLIEHGIDGNRPKDAWSKFLDFAWRHTLPIMRWFAAARLRSGTREWTGVRIDER